MMPKAYKLIALFAAGFLFLAPFGGIRAGVIEDLRQQIETRNQEIKTLQQKMEEAKNNLQEAQGKERSLQNQIYKFNKQIEALELEIAITENQVEETRLTIQKIEAQMVELEQSIRLEKVRIGSVLQLIYETGEPNLIEVTLQAENLSSMFQNFYGVQKLESELQARLSETKKFERQLEQDKEEAKKEEEELLALRNKLTLQQDLTEDQKSEKNELLRATRQQEATYQRSVKQLESQRNDIQKEIVRLEAKLRYAIDPDALPKGKGILAWPVDEVRITQYYGSTSETGFINDGYQFHNGIDLAPTTGLGTPILAAGDGAVIATGNDGRYAYGKWIAINHKNGLVTLYGHLSKFAVSGGAQIKKGQIIGYMGSTGYSTGPHLHFTVYAENTFEVIERWYGPLPIGGHIDPLEYL